MKVHCLTANLHNLLKKCSVFFLGTMFLIAMFYAVVSHGDIVFVSFLCWVVFYSVERGIKAYKSYVCDAKYFQWFLRGAAYPFMIAMLIFEAVVSFNPL